MPRWNRSLLLRRKNWSITRSTRLEQRLVAASSNTSKRSTTLSGSTQLSVTKAPRCSNKQPNHNRAHYSWGTSRRTHNPLRNVVQPVTTADARQKNAACFVRMLRHRKSNVNRIGIICLLRIQAQNADVLNRCRPYCCPVQALSEFRLNESGYHEDWKSTQ